VSVPFCVGRGGEGGAVAGAADLDAFMDIATVQSGQRDRIGPIKSVRASRSDQTVASDAE
jgi:hypothetical protein